MNKVAHVSLALVLALLLNGSCLADATLPQEGTPYKVAANGKAYQVVKGDTLWAISARFLKDPWLWPEVWANNRHIANPHLIYPGDLVHLGLDGQGRPAFTIQRGGSGSNPREVVLVPEMVISPAEQNEDSLSSLQKDNLTLFLKRNSLITANLMTGMGHIAAPTINHIAFSQGETVLLSVNDKVSAGETLAVYRNSKPLVHPETGEILGVRVEHLGMVRVERLTPQGPVARIVESYEEIHAQDLVSWPINLNMDFQVHFPAAEPEVKGAIAHLQHNLEEVGSNQIVTVALGRQHHLTQGAVMTIYRAGRVIRDEAKKGQWDLYPPVEKMPEEKIGTAVIFFLGEKAAYALLMRTQEPVRVGDILANH